MFLIMKEIKHLLIVRIVFLNDDLDLTRKGLASRKTSPKYSGVSIKQPKICHYFMVDEKKFEL